MDDPVAEIPHIIRTLCTAPAKTQRATIETYFTTTASFTHPFCRTGSFAGSIWLIIMIYRWYKILSPNIEVSVDSVAFDEEHLRLYVSVHQNFKLWMVPFYNAPVRLVTVLQLTTDPIPPEPPCPLQHLDLPASPDDVAKGKEKAQNGKKVNFSPFAKEPRSTALSHRAILKEADDEGYGDEEESDKYYIQSQNDLYQTTEFIKFVVPWGLGVLCVVIWQFFATILCVFGVKGYDVLMWLPRKLRGAHFEVFDNQDKAALGDD